VRFPPNFTINFKDIIMETNRNNREENEGQRRTENFASQSGQNDETYGFNPDEAEDHDAESTAETGRYDDSDYDNEGSGTGENALGSGSETNNGADGTEEA
jgi:hypothetical protein